MSDFYNAEYLSERVAALAQERDDLRRENNYLKDLCDRQARLNLVNAKLQMDLDKVTAERDAWKSLRQNGEWKPYHDHFTKRQIGWICTNCSGVQTNLSNGDTEFCPHCGALMDGEEEE